MDVNSILFALLIVAGIVALVALACPFARESLCVRLGPRHRVPLALVRVSDCPLCYDCRRTSLMVQCTPREYTGRKSSSGKEAQLCREKS